MLKLFRLIRSLLDDDERVKSVSPALAARAKSDDRWEGEDEEEDVKDNWDDDDEEEDKTSKETTTSSSTAKPTAGGKKKLAKKIAEKEAKQREKLESKLSAMTPEEQLREKLERQRLVEESDLRIAAESFGVSSPIGSGNLDNNNLVTKDDFDSFRKNLVDKLKDAEKSPHYVSFLEALSRELCTALDPEDMKRISSALTILANEKIKASKGTKKKAKKGAAIKVDTWQETAYGDSEDDYADFM